MMSGLIGDSCTCPNGPMPGHYVGCPLAGDFGIARPSGPSGLTRAERVLRILDFDIENRPLSYWVPDRPTAEVTSIAWMVAGDHDSLRVVGLAPPCWHKGHELKCPDMPSSLMSMPDLLDEFRAEYDRADMVTGHYIIMHDLPIVNAMLYEQRMPLLGDKLVSDTKLHMFSKKDLPATQEYLLELLDVTCPLGMVLEKFHMTQPRWREANRLSPEGTKLTVRRVTSDVHAHSHMREAMLDQGWLSGPKVWRSGGEEVVVGRAATGESK